MDASLNRRIYFYYIWHCLIRHIFTIKQLFKAPFILKIFQYKIYSLPDMSILQIIQSHREFKNNKIITLLPCWTGLDWADWAGPAIRMGYQYESFALIITYTEREIESDDGVGRSIPASDSPTRKEKYKLSVVQASRELSAIVLDLQLQHQWQLFFIFFFKEEELLRIDRRWAASRMRNGHVQIVRTRRSAPQQARIRRTSQARTDRRHSASRRRPTAV